MSYDFGGRGRGSGRGSARRSWRGRGRRGAGRFEGVEGSNLNQAPSNLNTTGIIPGQKPAIPLEQQRSDPPSTSTPNFSTDIDGEFGHQMNAVEESRAESGSRDRTSNPGPHGADPNEGSSSRKIQHRLKQLTLSPEELLAMNKEVIHMLPAVPGSQEHYMCTVCRSILSDATIKAHVYHAEHIKKLKLVSVVDKTDPFWCSYCCILLGNDDVYRNHMVGKKHKQHVDTVNKFNEKWTKPIGNKLDSIVMDRSRVVKEGNGQTLGLTATMMKFRADIGPYIGLKYAQETGCEGGYPDYMCTLCQVHSDPGNRLHFTSAAHRMGVLQKDYPAKFIEMNEFSSGKKRGEMNSKLKEIATEIEAVEGRRVELIQRRILAGGGPSKRKTIPGQDLKKGNSSWRDASANQRPATLSSPGNARGGRGKPRGGGPMFDGSRGGHKKQWVPYGQHGGHIHVPGRGGYSSQNQQGFWAGSNTDTQFGGGNYAQQHQPGPSHQQEFGSGGYGSGQGGRQELVRYHPYARGQGGGRSGWSVGRGMGREGYEKGRSGWSFGAGRGGGYGGGEQGGGTWFGDDGSGYGGVVGPVGGAGGMGGASGMGYGGRQDWSSDIMPQQHAKIGGVLNNQLQKLKGETGDKTEALKALATTMINSEEDAENAFQLSSALTQALLDFRMKSLDSMIPDNPLTSLLKVLQKESSQDK